MQLEPQPPCVFAKTLKAAAGGFVKRRFSSKEVGDLGGGGEGGLGTHAENARLLQV